MFTKIKLKNIHGNLTWEILQINIDFNGLLYNKAKRQAMLKSKYTMNAGQNGAYRSEKIKQQKQLMGTLAEIYGQEYLKIINKKLNKNFKIIRYDDVRTDGFKSPENEYDIRIVDLSNPEKYYNVESRSSIAHNRSLKAAIEQFDIIGPYTSIAKHNEKMNDIYIRPLYDYTASEKYFPSNFEKHLLKNEIKLYIVAACSKLDMINKGYDKSMGQGKTSYRVVKITDAKDAIKFIPIFALL